MDKPLVINLFAGPGAGKSTSAAAVFALLKMHGVNAELITEFAKDLTWEKRNRTLDNQVYVFAKQYHKMWRVKDQVDVIITDSPLLLSFVYGLNGAGATSMVWEAYHDFNNVNFFIGRVKKFNPVGRNQTEEEANKLDEDILNVLKTYKMPFEEVVGDYGGVNLIVIETLKRLGITDYNFKIVDRRWFNDVAKKIYEGEDNV